MLYLKIFWIALIALFFIHLFSNLLKFKKLENLLDKYGILYMIILVAFAFIAIITNDPIDFFNISIPTEVQWLATLIASGFGAWKYYLNPLKNRVINTEIEVSSVKTSIESIKSDVHLIKENLLNDKKRK